MMADTPDLSKIIATIIENPDLIARIQELANGKGESTAEAAAEPVSAPEPEKEIAVPASADDYEPRQRRNKLLSAMKPYLSNERAKAIDSMLSVAEILDMMKSR